MKIEVSQKKFELFPTLIYKGTLSEHKKIKKELKQKIRKERDGDPEGIERSNAKNLGSWHSHNNLQVNKPFSEFIKIIEAFTYSISEDWNYSKSCQLSVTQLWAIINPPGSYNTSHTHPGCLWSGVYYVQVPKNSGAIVFDDPRAVAVAVSGKYEERNKPRHAWTRMSFIPEEGDLYIFPSWLTHHVRPNLSEKSSNKNERIILSFNIDQL